jgi:hypothetical protein
MSAHHLEIKAKYFLHDFSDAIFDQFAKIGSVSADFVDFQDADNRSE